jgi:hypothetical protein
MLSHRLRRGRPGLTVLAGALATLGAVGAFAVSASSAVAAPARPAVSAPARHAPSAPAAMAVFRAPTSSFVAFTGHDFTGTAHDISGCGLHNLPLPVGSYKWFARGQSGRMYNCRNAACAVNFVLSSNQNASQSTGVGWKSLFIVC